MTEPSLNRCLKIRVHNIYNLLSQAGRFGLSAEEARAEIDRLVDGVHHWRDSFFACGVSAKDIDYIATTWATPR